MEDYQDEMLSQDYLLERIHQGVVVENLIKNEGWKLVITNLQKRALESFWKLANVNPNDSGEVTKYQNRIKRYSDLVLEVDLILQQKGYSEQAMEQLTNTGETYEY